MIAIITAFLLIAVLQGKNLIKNREWKGLVVFGLLLIIGFGLSILMALDVLIPDPVEAIKYQMLVMFLIGGGTGLGVIAAIQLGAYRLTDERHRLRLDRLAPAKE